MDSVAISPIDIIMKRYQCRHGKYDEEVKNQMIKILKSRSFASRKAKKINKIFVESFDEYADFRLNQINEGRNLHIYTKNELLSHFKIEYDWDNYWRIKHFTSIIKNKLDTEI